MSVTIHCPHCGATGNAPDHILGQSVRCSKCKKQFVAGGEDEHDEGIQEEAPADDFDDMDDDAPPPPRRRGGGGGRSRSSGGGGGGGGFGEFATFRTLVAPRVIVILFWVIIAFLILGILGAIVVSFFGGAMNGIVMLILAPIFGILYFLFIRIGFEMMIIQFRIYEALKDLKKPE